MKNILKKLLPIIGLIPFIVGGLGYSAAGEKFTDSLYASFALYFTNPISDSYNGFIEFARWTAPLVTMTAVLSVLKNVWDRIGLWIRGFAGDSVAVYSDCDVRVRFGKRTRAIYPGTDLKSYVKSHILLFSDDQTSLRFYEEHRDILERKAVYIGLRETETGMIDMAPFENAANPPVLFDINGAVARELWKTVRLWEREEKNFRIALFGDNALAQAILSYGLQLNIFARNQHIQYHVIAGKSQFRAKHPALPLQNNDEILYHAPCSEDAWCAVRNADIVIVAETLAADLFQTIAVNAANAELYYYAPQKGGTGDYIALGGSKAFGEDTLILTDENIRRQELEQSAMELNARYAGIAAGDLGSAGASDRKAAWNRLSGFLKNSNISAADYQEVIAALLDTVPDDELAEFEHIRWCRFHYLNYWQYGEPEDGGLKDAAKRIHKDLLPYCELSEEEKKKDFSTIELVRRKIS